MASVSELPFSTLAAYARVAGTEQERAALRTVADSGKPLQTAATPAHRLRLSLHNVRQRRPLRLETSKTLLSSTNRAFPWKTLPQLKRYNSYSGAVGEGDFAVYDLHSVEKVVSDQKVAVEVSEVGKRGELGCG